MQIPQRLKKAVYRKIRYSPWTERFQNALRRETSVYFTEIDLAVPAGPGDVIIDAGANVGDVTSRCARTGATIHAFEPNPICYSILEKRFANLSNVRVHNVGLMDKPCSLTLSTPLAHKHYDSIDSTVAASFVASSPDGVQMVETEVECIDLASFIRDLAAPVTLLKMDIEGAEVPVLNRLIDTGDIDQVRLAIVETHERFSPELAAATDALRERLKTNGLDAKVRLDWI
jgi:FkbM family methyltransferase